MMPLLNNLRKVLPITISNKVLFLLKRKIEEDRGIHWIFPIWTYRYEIEYEPHKRLITVKEYNTDTEELITYKYEV